MNSITDLTGELQATLKAARDIAATAESEDRDFTETERTDLKAKLDGARDLRKRLDEAKADDQLRSAIADLGDGIELNAPRSPSTPAPIEPVKGASLGEHFVNSSA